MIEKLKIKMLAIAILKHRNKKVEPCGDLKSFSECFSQEKNKLLFWYNIGNDTHMITETLK